MERNREGVQKVPRVYTVCDESRYLIIRNVPALHCVEELVKLFGSYGPIEKYKRLDDEKCDPFTEAYWIKFVHNDNARFAKRKLDEFNFFGNLLKVTYAPTYEDVSDVRIKLDERKQAVINRINSLNRKGKRSILPHHEPILDPLSVSIGKDRQYPSDRSVCMGREFTCPSLSQNPPTESMTAAIRFVPQKLKKISNGSEAQCILQQKAVDLLGFPATETMVEDIPVKKQRTDNRRRI